MSPTTHDSPARGHRVREFVCAYRTLRDDQGQPVLLPTKALSDPRIAAATLAPLLASETVEVFAVACLSTRHQLLAWHVLSRGTRAAIPHRAQTMRDSLFGWRGRPTSSTCRCSIT